MRRKNYRTVIIFLLCFAVGCLVVGRLYNHRTQHSAYVCPSNALTNLFYSPKALSSFVKIYNAQNETEAERKTIENNKCVKLKTVTGKETPICVYDVKTDKYISKDLMQSGTWEIHIVSKVVKLLREDPDIVYLDLGCNIGVFSISAALLGHQVYAVDPNKMNLRLLSKSLSLGNFKNDVTLFLNAVSDTHELVSLSEDTGNVGGLHAEKIEGDTSAIDDDHIAVAITLDDLRPFMCRKKVFIKMDVEGFEYNALKGAELFFEEIDIKYVLMEWFQHALKASGDQIIQFMTRFSFLPHKINKLEDVLDVKDSGAWPENVIWIKS